MMISLWNKVKITVLCFSITLFAGCGNSFSYEDFVPSDPSLNEDVFKKDSARCEADQNKYSSKIEGRELGFEGEHAAYLGCMKLKGWDRKSG